MPTRKRGWKRISVDLPPSERVGHVIVKLPKEQTADGAGNETQTSRHPERVGRAPEFCRRTFPRDRLASIRLPAIVISRRASDFVGCRLVDQHPAKHGRADGHQQGDPSHKPGRSVEGVQEMPVAHASRIIAFKSAAQVFCAATIPTPVCRLRS